MEPTQKPITFHALKDEELCKDGKPHDFKDWVEFADGCGGTAICTKCGLDAFTHSLRYSL